MITFNRCGERLEWSREYLKVYIYKVDDFFFGNLKDHSMNRKCSNCRISIIRHDLSMMMHAIMHVTNLIYILDEFLLRNLKDH